MAMSAALFKALVLVVAFVGVAVLARPSKDSSAHSESSTTAEVPVVTSESFLRELFEELDSNKDGVVSKAEIANLVEKLAGEKPFNEQEVMESMQEFLGFQDFSKQIRELAYPAFDPIKNDRAAPKQRSLSPAEVRALEVFSSRIQPSVRRSNQAVRRTHSRPLHPGQIFNVYKIIRDQDHIEDLFDEADLNKDTDVMIHEAASLMKAYKVRIDNSEILQYFVRIMNERGVVTSFSDFRIFLESVARSCHHHVTGQFVINKSLRDRCYVQQCLIENEKYRTYPEPFATTDKEELKSEIAYYASFVDHGDTGISRNFDRLLRSKSFRRNLRNPIYTC